MIRFVLCPAVVISPGFEEENPMVCYIALFTVPLQRRRSVQWSRSWTSMASTCPPLGRSEAFWPVRCVCAWDI